MWIFFVRPLQELWPGYRFSVTLDQSLLLTLEDETRWAIMKEWLKAASVCEGSG